MQSFSGKLALVTGASAGLGYEFALALHTRGANLWLVARREEQLKAIADKLNQVRANSVTYRCADLSAQSDGAQSRNQLISELKATPIDLLINNAGFGSFGEFDLLPLERELQMVNLNISATLILSHAVIPQMKARRSGGIISVSSIAGFQPLPYMATYAATKAFNFSHSMALREELRRYGIKVTVLCPGPTATEFGMAASVPDERLSAYHDRADKVVAATLDAYLAGRAFVVPGFRSYFSSLLSRVTPKALSTRIMARLLRVDS